ncbi:hypothetical protein KSS87_005151 [Heliosperma pusillum]|nr:hypothetical protein KSS87_005151 [Heliosperma pusillum]
MDTNWITLPNDHSNYIDGCLKFIAIAKESLVEGKTKCPCKNCKLRYWLPLSEVEGHILFKGFYQKYTNWIWHGKEDVLDYIPGVDVGSTSKGSYIGRDDMSGLLDAANLVNVSNFSKKVNDELPRSPIKNSDLDASMGCSYSDDSNHEYGSHKLHDDESHNESDKPSKGNNNEEDAKQWLDEHHTYRSQGSLFDGTTEYRSAPICASGSDVLRQQEGIDYIYGKSKKRQKRKNRARKVGVETIFNRSKRNDDVIQDMDCYLYESSGRVIGAIEKLRLDDKSLKQVHRYILLHTDEMNVVLKHTQEDWPDEVAFDEKEDVMTIDKEGNYKMVSDSIQPHDVWHADGTKYFVTFNEFYQPLEMGGHILIRFIGDVAKTERFCPNRETDWRHVSAQLKVDIVKLIRARFVIPDGELFDQAILKCTGKSVRQYRHHLKKMRFNPMAKTKEQIYEAVPTGHPRASWIHLVDYWYSEKGKEENNKREPSVLEIFKRTHRKKDGTFVKDTMTEDFLIDVDASIYTATVMHPTSSKSRVLIENEAFNSVMYGNEVPKRPVGYGYGVNQSDVLGVHGILRKHGISSGESNSLALDNMKHALADVTKENKVLVKKHEVLQSKCDESNVLLKKMTTQFGQILDIFSTGKATAEFIGMAKSVLNMANKQMVTMPRLIEAPFDIAPTCV